MQYLLQQQQQKRKMSAKDTISLIKKDIMKVEIENNNVGKIISKSARSLCGNSSRSKKPRFSMFHLTLIILFAFWAGVVFSHCIIDTSTFSWNTSISSVPSLYTGKASEVVNNKDVFIEEKPVKPVKLIMRDEKNDENENMNDKKTILLHGDKIWTKYDKWSRYDWRKCPPKYSNCRITTDNSRISEVNAVVYNAARMPDSNHVKKIKEDSSVKRVFLSGLTPLKTTFDPELFNDFFDLTITYKGDSDIRIPYWPNDGLLPAMYRPKTPGKSVEGEDMLDLEEDVTNYFKKFGKDNFLSYTLKNCSSQHYPTLFVGKLREEGLINTYSLNKSSKCLNRIKETVVLPCHGINTDDCVKHFEQFKFTIVPDEDLCLDYTTRDYWIAIFAWQSVPLLYGASDYTKYLIPNSYIDCVGQEDYISPSFKKAYGPSQDAKEYYKKFHLWRHEDRVEEFHWQCELCKNLNKYEKIRKKLNMVDFWNKDTNCGTKLKIHELMRLQLVRTGVISG